MVRLYHGDCLDVLPTLEENSVDSIVTDPPYGLEFMGKDWDHGVPGVHFWTECLRVAKPGAMLLTFGGTRTHHRLMCAIEDAGWEIRDCLMWLYGSGFPKSHDISKTIDKAAGAEREVVGIGTHGVGSYGQGMSKETGFRPYVAGLPSKNNGGQHTITAPATPAAELWDGWGTALKPAWEPIILAMKPRAGTFAQNALEWGVAGLAIDQCRIGTETITQRQNGGGRKFGRKYDGHGENIPVDGKITQTQGRWPANLVLSHTPECRRVGVRKVKPTGGRGPTQRNCTMLLGQIENTSTETGPVDPDGTETIGDWRCVPECPVRLLDEQSGESVSQGGNHSGRKGTREQVGDYGYDRITINRPRDSGGASRFFYCAKASRSERTCGGEIENRHPTVKPLALCRWLCRLTKTPTGGVVLDPFMGSGSIGVAAVMEGREFVGIELERESFEVAEQRIGRAKPEIVQAEMGI